MAVGMTMDELAALLPLEQRIPITDAAKMLGGGATRIKALMDSVMTGGLFSWTHSIPHRPPAVLTHHKTGVTKELPYLTPDTDPSTVLVESKEILWRWSLEVEELLLAVDGDGRAPRDRVTARLQALQSRAYELKTGSKLAPLGCAESCDIDPADIPEELHMANLAFRAVTNGYGDATATFRNRVVSYLNKTWPGLSKEQVARIATVANPDKAPGRKSLKKE